MGGNTCVMGGKGLILLGKGGGVKGKLEFFCKLPAAYRRETGSIHTTKTLQLEMVGAFD